LVAFNKAPENVAELETMLFDEDYLCNEHTDLKESPKVFAALIFNQIVKSGSYVRGCGDMTDKKLRKEQMVQAKNFFKQNRQSKVFWLVVPESVNFEGYSGAFRKLRHKAFWN
jgi:hypothetical protein